MRINTNVAALNSYNQLNNTNNNLSKSLERLSSGKRINGAADDAAGLAISEKMGSQTRGLAQAQRNAQDGISMIQTAEGALKESHSILQRMRELSVQSANDTNTDADRAEIQKEINQLTSEINRIGNTTEFNTKKLLNGNLSDSNKTGNSTTTIKAESASYGMTYGKGITWSAEASGEDPVITDGAGNKEISFSGTAGTFDWSSVDTSGGDNELVIERDGSELRVNFSGSDGSGDTLTIDNEAVLKDENGDYSYNANGISFEVSAEEFEKFEDTSKVTFALNDYNPAGSGTTDFESENVGTVSDFEQTVSGTSGDASFSTSGISINSDEIMEGIENVSISGTSLGTSGSTYTVTLSDSNGAVVTDTFEQTSGGTFSNLTYDNHGVSFDITVNGATEITADKDIDTSSTTVEETEDASALFQIGANENQSMNLSVSDMRASSLEITGSGDGYTSDAVVTDGTNSELKENALNVSTASGSSNAIDVLDNAIERVSQERSKLGAKQNRLDHTINNLNTAEENLTAAESRISDVDMAKEMMNMSKQQILSQAGTAMMAQANQLPQGVLQLLG